MMPMQAQEPQTAASTQHSAVTKAQTHREDTFKLSEACPPSFEKLSNGACKFRSLYQLYPSLQDHGIGGLKTGLPDIRDGFTAKEIDLGRYLFFDPALSGDGSMSCATCHDPDKGFADGLGTSMGPNGSRASRSAPSLWNVGFLKRLFWDVRAGSLEEQMLGPLYSEIEMANTPENLLATLNNIPAYRDMFADAFGTNPADEITLDQIYHAIAAFEASLVSFNSRYDQYAHGYHDALNKEEIAGLNLFRSFVARCSECHTPPLFTNQETAVIVTPEPEGMPFDVGAEKTFDDPTMRAAFKVPTLRNIALSAPYMHSGALKTMREAVKFYNDGRGHAIPEGQEVRVHWHIWEPNMREEELDQLVAFLGALTDESMKPKTPEKVPSGLPPVSADAFQKKFTEQYLSPSMATTTPPDE
ncbi:hypothetical protein GCM10017044_14730 [Kordiimonas sediminis]|uniref:Methylamine utilization protein MauG n=2 Tax=Kordiimonas sediminis TaxID=1735581 RepID=A0A919ARG3_9PROT|nr:hypothetical protein GCM10017044_14730 [Kordiimonas sediminis]